MSQMLKCPNPSCPYVFDPSQVPVGVVLSCPRCGMQFTLGAPATQAPTQPPPPQSNFPPGAGAPATPAPSSSRRKEPASDRSKRERPPEPAAALPRRSNNLLLLMLLGGLMFCFISFGGVVLFVALKFGGSSGSNEIVTRYQDYNVGVAREPEGWTRDDDLRVKLGSPYLLAYTRKQPEAYIAFGANTPATQGRAPRPSEMRKDLLEAFPKLFDMSTFREEVPVENQWLGQNIATNHGLKFRVQSSDGLTWVGEAYTVAFKGIAYYWVCWCGENDYEAVKGEFTDFRNKFKLLSNRDTWKQTQSSVIDFKGDKVGYTISDAEELWKELPPAEFKPLKDIEPDLDKRLRINLTPKRDRKAIPDQAELSVYLLDGGNGDATATAQKFAEDMETLRIKQANPDLTPPTFKELTDEPHGDPTPDTVPASTPVKRLLSNVKESRDAGRLIVVSGINKGGKTVVVHCWCEGRKRDVFETKFVQIAASLR